MIGPILIILLYLSFVLDFLVWPIPSEASSKSLTENKKATLSTRILIWSVFGLNLLFYLAPLALAIAQLLSTQTTLIPFMAFVGISIAAIGRLVSIKGTLTIKAQTSADLITTSIFKVSRNPISLGMHITILGLIVCFNNWVLWLGFILYLLNMHFKIVLEEKFLLQKYGEHYSIYTSKTPRYLIW
jgi:protein-S-isoprenylcysteine O-methyltransferase Ste14